jgi:hypothetical protein
VVELSTQSEALDERTVAVDVDVRQVAEKTTTLANHLHLAAIQVKEPDLRCFDRLLAWTKGGAA